MRRFPARTAPADLLYERLQSPCIERTLCAVFHNIELRLMHRLAAACQYASFDLRLSVYRSSRGQECLIFIKIISCQLIFEIIQSSLTDRTDPCCRCNGIDSKSQTVPCKLHKEFFLFYPHLFHNIQLIYRNDHGPSRIS